MSQTVQVILNLIDNVSKGVNSANKSLDTLSKSADAADKALDDIDGDGFNKISKSATEAANTASQSAAKSADTVNKAYSHASTVVGNAFGKMKESGSKAATSIKNSFNSAAQGADTLIGAISGVIAGFGLMEIVGSIWTGSSQAQFNESYLSTKMSTEAAKEWVAVIQDVVSEVPGDDTFMNSLLTGAVARETSLTTEELKKLGIVTADYLTVSQAMGKNEIETQMDLKEYILTGNTSQLERDSILKNQIGKLEGQETVSERILAVDKALKAEGYEGLSQLDIAMIKWEAITGKIAAAATAIGTVLLPYVEKVFDFILDLDEKTGGLSSQLILVGGILVGVGGALALAAGPIMTILGGISTFGGVILSVLAPLLGGLSTLFFTLMSGGGIIGSLSAGFTAFSAALGPVGWAILAIVAIVGAAIYIWKNWSKEVIALKDAIMSGDWGAAAGMLANSFNYVKDAIWNALKGAGQAIWDYFVALPGMIGNASSMFLDLGSQLLNWIIEGLTSLSTSLDDILNKMLTPEGEGGAAEGGKEAGKTAGKGLIDGFKQWITDNGPKMLEAMKNEFFVLAPLLLKVIWQITLIVWTAIGKWVSDNWKTLIDGIKTWIYSLANKMGTWLSSVVNKIKEFAQEAWNKAKDAGKKIVDGIKQKLINLPGDMYTWGTNAINSFINAIIDSIPGLRGALDTVRSLFPASPPKEGPLSTIKPENIYSWGETLGTALKEGVDGGAQNIFSGVKGVVPSIPSVQNTATLSDQSGNAINAALNTKEGVTQAFNSMETGVTNSLNTLVSNDKTSWQKIKNNTSTQLDGIRKTTADVTSKMTNAWSGMAGGIVKSADKIRRDSSNHISNLAGNIKSFYYKISHPAAFLAGPGQTSSRNVSRGYAGIASSASNLIDSFFYNGAPCNDCYAGGWDVSSPNTANVKSGVNNFKLNVPGLNTILKVADFVGSKNPLRGNMGLFEYLAAKLIDPTHYDFYYNGRYSNQEAIARGAFNCWDGAEILVALANALEIPAQMVHGHWGSIGHMAARVGGAIFDTTQRQNRGVWRGTPGVGFGGPVPINTSIDTPSDINLNVSVDLQNVPAGNSNKAIADMVADSMKDRKVIDAMKEGLGRGANRSRRVNGV